jgi:hypothetical protein
MTTDLDIYRAANELIRQHGGDAPVRAAMRHDELLKAGDVEGCVIWRCILRVIYELFFKDWKKRWVFCRIWRVPPCRRIVAPNQQSTNLPVMAP